MYHYRLLQEKNGTSTQKKQEKQNKNFIVSDLNQRPPALTADEPSAVKFVLRRWIRRISQAKMPNVAVSRFASGSYSTRTLAYVQQKNETKKTDRYGVILLTEYHANSIRLRRVILLRSDIRLRRVIFATQVKVANRISRKP